MHFPALLPVLVGNTRWHVLTCFPARLNSLKLILHTIMRTRLGQPLCGTKSCSHVPNLCIHLHSSYSSTVFSLSLCVRVGEAVHSLLRASFFAEKLAISFLFDTCALGLAAIEAEPTKKSKPVKTCQDMSRPVLIQRTTWEAQSALWLCLRLVWWWHVAVVILVPLEKVKPFRSPRKMVPEFQSWIIDGSDLITCIYTLSCLWEIPS